MKKFNRFCRRYERYGIRNLMIYMMAGQALVYLADLLQPDLLLRLHLCFYWPAVLHGEVWRIVTGLFVPSQTELFFMIFTVLICSMIGYQLERSWGRMKTTVYYFSGVGLTFLVSALFGMIADTSYVNFSVALAFATLHPNMEFRLYFAIPVKGLYFIVFQTALYLLMVVITPYPLNLLPVAAFANYLLFLGGAIPALLPRRSLKQMRKDSERKTRFKNAVRQAQKPYRHRCAACGLTDIDDPNMEFRYCSLCSDYPCYCTQHLFRHQHK